MQNNASYRLQTFAYMQQRVDYQLIGCIQYIDYIYIEFNFFIYLQ